MLASISATTSSHYIQAHSLINLHIIHAPPCALDTSDARSNGFQIYSPLRLPSVSSIDPSSSSNEHSKEVFGTFTRDQLLYVMQLLNSNPSSSPILSNSSKSIPYFALCRKLGVGAVDGMVRGRILELRWSDTITDEDEPEVGPSSMGSADGSSSLKVKERKEWKGPIVLPTTRVIGYAMRQVLKEYECDNLDEILE